MFSSRYLTILPVSTALSCISGCWGAIYMCTKSSMKFETHQAVFELRFGRVFEKNCAKRPLPGADCVMQMSINLSIRGGFDSNDRSLLFETVYEPQLTWRWFIWTNCKTGLAVGKSPD